MTLEHGHDRNFGGAIDSIIESVATTAGKDISVADIGSKEAFIDGWATTLKAYAKYLVGNKVALKAPVCIVFVPDAGTFGRTNQWHRRATLGSSSIDNLQGVLAVGTAPIGGFVFPYEVATMGDVEKNLYAANLDKCPTIALTSDTKLIIWPHGVSSEQVPITCEVGVDAPQLELTELDNRLNIFYEEIARQSIDWWLNSKDRVTVLNPENAVQYVLWAFLSGRYSEIAKVKREYDSGNGRADITILPSRAQTKDKSAVIELKTIRDVRTPTKDKDKTPTKISKPENIRWACSGIQQTASYRDHERLDGAFLCIYDFCKEIGPEVIKEVEPLAKRYDVEHRHYWITASNEEHRKDRYPL